MRFDSSTFYSIIGVVPFSRKYLHSTSVPSSIYSFSNTSKVTIRWRLTQPSSPLTKKKSPLWSQAELLAWAKQTAFASFPPPRQRGLWCSARSKQRWKPSIQREKRKQTTKLLSRWGSWDGEARQQMVLLPGNTPLPTGLHRLGAKKRQGSCPWMPPRWPHRPPFAARGGLPTPRREEDVALRHTLAMGRAVWRNCYSAKQQLSRSALHGGGEERREPENERGKEKLLAKVVMHYRTFSCWFHSSNVWSCRGMVHSPYSGIRTSIIYI